MSSLGMYALVRRLGCTPLVAGWAGLVFMLFPGTCGASTSGTHRCSTSNLPRFSSWRYTSGSKARTRTCTLVGIATAGGWLVSGYWGAMAVIGTVAFALMTSALRVKSDGLARVGSQLALVVLSTLLGTLAVGLLRCPDSRRGITILAPSASLRPGSTACGVPRSRRGEPVPRGLSRARCAHNYTGATRWKRPSLSAG